MILTFPPILRPAGSPRREVGYRADGVSALYLPTAAFWGADTAFDPMFSITAREKGVAASKKGTSAPLKDAAGAQKDAAMAPTAAAGRVADVTGWQEDAAGVRVAISFGRAVNLQTKEEAHALE